MPNHPSATSDPRQPYAIWVAIFSLAAFGIITFALFLRAGTDDPAWSHYMVLYNGIQAVAFAGAGFLFGKEVNRGRAEAAESLASQERQRAEDNSEGAANGKALAAQLKEKAKMTTGSTTTDEAEDEPSFANVGTRGVPSASPGSTGGTGDHLQELAGVAERLFPKA